MLFKDVPQSLTFKFKGKIYRKGQNNTAVPLEDDAPEHTFLGHEHCELEWIGGKDTKEKRQY